MDRLIEFVTNHYLLVTALVVLVTLLIITESRRGGETLTPQAAVGLINRQNALVVDLRKDDDFRKGHIAGSINVPWDQLDNRLSELKGHEGPIVLVDDSGARTGAAGRHLRGQGIADIRRVSGGLQAWRGEKLPLVTT